MHQRKHYGLYPFSISQIREKRLGFDFGYELSKGNVFLVQFKRPYVKENGKIKWNIEKEQAEVLVKQPARAYYALPAFLDGKDWYEGLDKTFFDNYDQLLKNISKEFTADTIDKLMMDKICLFEPAKIHPKRVWNACDTEDAVFLVMGNVLNLQKEDNFYLIRYEGRSLVLCVCAGRFSFPQ